MMILKGPIYPHQMINFFEDRLTELTRKIEGSKRIKEGQLFRVTPKKYTESLVVLYNLNLRLLKLWKPREQRLEIEIR